MKVQEGLGSIMLLTTYQPWQRLAMGCIALLAEQLCCPVCIDRASPVPPCTLGRQAAQTAADADGVLVLLAVVDQGLGRLRVREDHLNGCIQKAPAVAGRQHQRPLAQGRALVH